MATPKRALVTGATGFIGGHLERRLVADGWKVGALVRPASKPLELPIAESLVYDGATEGLIALLKSFRPDVVFHLASLFVGEHAPRQVRPLVDSNVLFGAQLAEAMTQAGCLRLVNTGTAWQHMNDRVYDPVNLYAATKQAFAALLAYYRALGLRAVTLELFDTYGPGDERAKLVPALLAAGGARMAFSEGRQKLDFVHVDDVVAAYLLAAERTRSAKPGACETYAVRSGRSKSLRQIVAAFEDASGRKLAVDWGARPYRRREMMRPWSKGKLLPGWKAKISLEEGLRALCRR